MRLLIAAVLGLATPAAACPPLESCAVGLSSATRGLPIAHEREVQRSLLAMRSLPTIRKRAPGEIEMPWIWRVLREQVYSRMPTYEQPQKLKIVLAPVVVTSPADTVPGLGLSGDF